MDTLNSQAELQELREALRKIWQITSDHTHLDPDVYNNAYRRGAAACAWAVADAMGWH